MKYALLLLALLPALAMAGEVDLAQLPAQPLIEVRANQQIVNFDVLLTNNTAEELEVSRYQLTVLGPKGEMVAQRRLDTNGMGILTLPNRVVKPGEKVVLFNPLYSWGKDVPLGTMRLDIALDAGETSEKVLATLDLHPRRYENHAKLILPVTGRTFIHDGHDYVSHHRRLDVTGGMATALGIDTNMTRYAYDFVIVDEKGRMYRGDGEKNEDWYGFGTPVVAPADGVVVAMSDGQPDNTKSHKALKLSMEAFMANHNLPLGNFVILDHGHGEFSTFAHFKNGSVAVKKGEHVRQGQQIGQMGFSGDAFLVHLHYQLQRDANWGEGLPSYFSDVERFDGSRFVPVADGQIDSGDVVRSTRRP
ncbi:M23 family metallopeptidase [Dyella sp.]|uniref:M23 family metallopeptidase n=1 Tax=Dyella sp. TaxID=1869338 RepID=UPI002D798EEC|nr:M23 family metallopeptidase [Dyella sp.]HET6431255.1 M23 family metallopeptidase [Dyella sp.]